MKRQATMEMFDYLNSDKFKKRQDLFAKVGATLMEEERDVEREMQ